jgi:hypothetical protein
MKDWVIRESKEGVVGIVSAIISLIVEVLKLKVIELSAIR